MTPTPEPPTAPAPVDHEWSTEQDHAGEFGNDADGTPRD
jgi:hypothetical protein